MIKRMMRAIEAMVESQTLPSELQALVTKARELAAMQTGAANAGGMIATVFIAGVLILVGLYFVATMAPMFGNITNPGGTVGTFLTLAEWVVPVLIIVGLIVWGALHLINTGSAGGDGGAAHARRKRKK